MCFLGGRSERAEASGPMVSVAGFRRCSGKAREQTVESAVSEALFVS